MPEQVTPLYGGRPQHTHLYRQLVTHAEANQARVYGVAESLFDYRPTRTPRLVVAIPSEIKDSDLESRIYRWESMAPKGIFFEDLNLMYINPVEVVEDVMIQRQFNNNRLDPKEHILRVVAKEYGQALYISLHNWNLPAKQHEYNSRIQDDDHPIRSVIPTTGIEAIGFITAYKVAKKLKQRDGYMKDFNFQMDAASEAIEHAPQGQINQLIMLTLAMISAKKFIQSKDEKFRELVRREPQEWWDEIYELMK